MQIHINKILRLKNVLETQIDFTNPQSHKNSIFKIKDFISSNNLKEIGPFLEKKTHPIDNKSKVESYILIQVDKSIDQKNLPKTFNFHSMMTINNCLFLEYHGDMTKIGFAYSKLELFVFENNLTSLNCIYTAFITNDGIPSKAHIFLPLEDNNCQ